MKRTFEEIASRNQEYLFPMDFINDGVQQKKKRKLKQNFGTVATEAKEEEKKKIYEFRMLSVRQPWADALLKNIKKIENRTMPIPEKIQPSWLALHVSKTFNLAEKSEGGWQDRAENAKLQETCGKIIGLIRFKDCLNSKEAKKLDPLFTDRPKKSKFHWLVDKVISVEEPIFHESNCRFPRVSDINARKILTQLLHENDETQYHVPPPKPKDKVFCEHCWKQYSKPKALENHLKNHCEFTGNVNKKRKAISNLFLA